MLMLGERWRKLMQDYGCRGDVLIVPSTATREVFERGVAFCRKPKKAPPIAGLFVGKLGKRKGVFELLPAMKLVKEMGVPCRLTLVGPQELEGELEEAMSLLKEHGVEDVVELTGALQGEELYSRFQQADFFIMPSHDEGLPVVFYEAGVFELPAIATPVGAIPDLLENEKNSLLVEPGNVEEIASAIRRMTEEHEERARMGAQLKKDVQRFHPDNVCLKIAQAVRGVLSG